MGEHIRVALALIMWSEIGVAACQQPLKAWDNDSSGCRFAKGHARKLYLHSENIPIAHVTVRTILHLLPIVRHVPA